jgi:hypothetical protein
MTRIGKAGLVVAGLFLSAGAVVGLGCKRTQEPVVAQAKLSPDQLAQLQAPKQPEQPKKEALVHPPEADDLAAMESVPEPSPEDGDGS